VEGVEHESSIQQKSRDLFGCPITFGYYDLKSTDHTLTGHTLIMPC